MNVIFKYRKIIKIINNIYIMLYIIHGEFFM